MYDFLSLKTDVNVTSKSKKQELKKETYFFVDILTSQLHESADPYQCHGSTTLKIRKQRTESGGFSYDGLS
jgi:hypothetical protein